MAAMYSDSSPYMHYVGLLEEILPFTDIIPSVTLAWYTDTHTPLPYFVLSCSDVMPLSLASRLPLTTPLHLSLCCPPSAQAA